MNKVITLFFMLTMSIKTLAEIPTQGIAMYKQTINIHASLPASQAALKAMIPEFKYTQLKVSFMENLLRVQKILPLATKKNESIKIMTSIGYDNIVLNTNKKLLTQYGTVVDIEYVYSQKINDGLDLKFVDEVKIINGYSCNKAIDEKNNFTIWYQRDSSQVVVPSENFMGIPGLVVKVEGKQISYDLISIKDTKIDGALFDIPKNHKEISYEQFQDLQEEAMEDMMNSHGKGTKMIKSNVN